MNTKQIFTGIFSFVVLTFVSVTPVFAVNTPDFSTCLNPQNPQANLQRTNTGTHGVPGNQQTYTGIDKVYSSEQDILSSATIMQCLCPDNGQGIQTNWWKVSDLTEDEIKILKSQGWIYIPDGSAWGLSNCAYLAKNVEYSCKSKTEEKQSSSSSSVAGVATQAVLGLANTGNIVLLYTLFGVGIIASGLAFLLQKNK